MRQNIEERVNGEKQRVGRERLERVKEQKEVKVGGKTVRTDGHAKEGGGRGESEERD